ncbi:relaxase/mobilization nuclease domain-containing protein [Pleurocapsales cyanobacterium LEGE 10410]|nr:relaxase/mobilization nuclease domain-containing protein [Pleurocapsales cyanobacterium LEGE 10410]
MLVKFFARGKGGGREPVEYITRLDDPKTKKPRNPAPEVLRGNPVITRRLIDSLEFKHKYRSGVLSFAPEDVPTDEQIEALIDSFEKYAFAGLDKDAYNILWVKHTHTGDNRVELHFVTPRVELYTGKSLNIAPPGWHGYFKPWQTNWNIEQGWARPDDPVRQRDYEPGFTALINAERVAKGLEAIADTRQLLTEYVLERVTAGLISNRDDTIALFKDELGLEITRKGKDYITVLDPDTDKRYRLKGKLYEREFRPQPEITAEIRPRTSASSRFNSEELRQARARVRNNYQNRSSYHQERYGASTVNTELDHRQVLADACWGRIEPLSGYLHRQLGNDAISVESDLPETGDIRLSRRKDRFSASRDKTAATDFRVNPEFDGRNNDYADGQRNISDSAELLDSNSWLEMPGKTLYEARLDNERTGKQANDRFRKVSRAIQAGHNEFVPQIQYGHESVREAEQAASYSSSEFELTSAGLERANREALRIQQQTDFHLPRIRRSLKKKRVKQLERFKTEINLVDYATSQGYEYLTRESSPNSAVLRHDLGDKIVVVTNTQGHGIYFSLNNERDRGTIVDFVQNRLNLNLGQVRKELRPWLSSGDCAPRSGKANHQGKYNIAKPEPTGRNAIDECLARLKHLNQLSPQPPKLKPKQKKRSQLEL